MIQTSYYSYNFRIQIIRTVTSGNFCVQNTIESIRIVEFEYRRKVKLFQYFYSFVDVSRACRRQKSSLGRDTDKQFMWARMYEDVSSESMP